MIICALNQNMLALHFSKILATDDDNKGLNCFHPAFHGKHALAQSGGLKDCVRGLLRCEGVDGDGDVGGAVEREATLVSAGEVGVVGEDGAEVLCAAAAGECGSEFDFEMDEERSGGGGEQ